MYVEEIKRINNQKIYKTVLVRESYREGKKVLHRTIANISKLPENCIQNIKRCLNGEKNGLNATSEPTISDSREYGASKTLINIAVALGLDKLIYSKKVQWRQNALAMIVGRIIYPGSKLSLTNMYLDTALWDLCGHEKNVKPDVNKDCYQSMDKLLDRQHAIQKQLAKKYLQDGCIVLYDITSTYFEGEYEDSELIKYGYNRDRKSGHEQINIGLLTNSEGCPIAIETFAGNVPDQVTVMGQVKNLVDDYNVKEVIFVGDRGMLTPKRIKEVNQEGFQTITALTRKQMQELILKNIIQPSQFKVNAYPEIRDPFNSKIRYVLCLNPTRQKDDFQTRMTLINKTIEKLDQIKRTKTKRSNEMIGAQVGKILAQFKAGKYFKWSVVEGKLEYFLNQSLIDQEQQIDGCYIIRADTAPETLSSKEIYKTYKKLIEVEQAFRIIKTTSLEIRPVFHHLDDRVRAHVFLCMLSYYLQWNMNQKLSEVYLSDRNGKDRRWSFHQVIERLKTIRRHTLEIDGVKLEGIVSTPDKEQKMLLDALDSKL